MKCLKRLVISSLLAVGVLAYNNKNDNVIITFRDKNLEKVIRDYINKPNGSIYKSDVEKITELQAFDMGIQDISGIENLTNLQEIGLSGNKISDITALKQLTNLQYIWLNDNKISNKDKQSLKSALPKCNIIY